MNQEIKSNRPGISYGSESDRPAAGSGEMLIPDDELIHTYFGLSYANCVPS